MLTIEFWHDPRHESRNELQRIVENDLARWPLSSYRREKNLVPAPLSEWFIDNEVEYDYEFVAERQECGRHLVRISIEMHPHDMRLFKQRWLLNECPRG